MEIIKKHYKKIISYGLIILGLLIALVVTVLHNGRGFYWYSAFMIAVGLTLLPFTKENK